MEGQLKGQLRHVLISSLKLKPIRIKPEDEAELKALAESWERRPVNPIVARSDLTLANGHRRIAGLKLLGRTHVWVLVTDGDMSDDELIEIGLVTAIHNKGLSGVEMAYALRHMKELRPTVTQKAMSELIKLDTGQISRLLSLFDCPPEVIEAAKEGLIGVGDWYAISRSPDPIATFQLKLAGATRDDLAASVKKNGKAHHNCPTRVTNIKLPLENGVTVSIKGAGVTLAAAREYAAQFIEKLKTAEGDGHTAKTLKAWLANKKPKARKRKGG